jgi:hypothetical protein
VNILAKGAGFCVGIEATLSIGIHEEMSSLAIALILDVRRKPRSIRSSGKNSAQSKGGKAKALKYPFHARGSSIKIGLGIQAYFGESIVIESILVIK